MIQADSFNRSSIKTVIVAVITKNTALAEAPGNVPLPASVVGLPFDSVINVSQLIPIDKLLLTEFVGRLTPPFTATVDAGLRLVVAL